MINSKVRSNDDYTLSKLSTKYPPTKQLNFINCFFLNILHHRINDVLNLEIIYLNLTSLLFESNELIELKIGFNPYLVFGRLVL